MDAVYASLSTRALDSYASLQTHDPTQRRILIALAGPPGAGKSTVATHVVAHLNSKHGGVVPFAVVLPMDGFHLTRAALDQLPNSDKARARRGAAWTFDAAGVVALVRRLRSSKSADEAIVAPAFDHATKDPVPNAITIPPSTSIIIIEGNWLLYEQEPWRQICELVDDTWFVDVASDLARQRIARRHLQSGIEKTWEAAVQRAECNDLINGEEIRSNLVKPSVMVQSVDETIVQSIDVTPRQETASAGLLVHKQIHPIETF